MVNWSYNNVEITDISQVPEGAIGFVYMVYDHTNNKYYIGRKSLYSTRKVKFGARELAAMTDKRQKKYRMVTKELKGWQQYNGSCKELNKKIKEGIAYTKEILQFCYTKQELTYYEVKYQMVHGAIEPGNSSYNENILGKFYPRLFSAKV